MRENLLTILAILILSTGIFAASPGALDSSFGVAGLVTTDIFGTDDIFDIKFLPDGKIVAVVRNSSQDFVVVRYTANGQLDTSFSGDGRRNIDFSNGVDSVEKVCVQSDNKLVIFGFTTLNSVTSTAVARLDPDGSNDLTFSADGLNTFPFGSFPTGCSIQADGKILFTLGGLNGGFATIRLNANGTLDPTFGSNGLVNTTVGGTSPSTNGVLTQPDGKIIVFGNRSSRQESVVVRYNLDGSLDTTFDGDGISLFNFAAGEENLADVKLQSSGKIVLGISQAAAGGGITVVKVARLLTNGALDTFFGVTDVDVPGTIADALDALFIESDESILLVLNRVVPSSRVLANLDGNNGDVTTKYGLGGFSTFLSITGNAYCSMLGDKLVIGSNAANDFQVRKMNLSKTPSMPSDFDGDGVSDTAVFRPSTGVWFLLRSSDNIFAAFPFGVNGDVPIDGDFDGDGKNDAAIFRPSNGQWWFLRSSDNSVFAAQFGTGTDKPIPGDYDRDGKTDIAVFRPATGEWLILRSSANFSTFFGYPFGLNGDIPISSERK